MKMKKCFFVFSLLLVVLLPLGLGLSACSVGTVRYLSVMPNVYEAELHEVDSTGNTYTYSVIKRSETIDGQTYQIFYGKFSSSVTDNEEEWFCVWNTDKEEWNNYLWSEDDQQWVKGVIGSTFDEVQRAATYASYTNANGVELKKTDLIKKTDEYLEYNWGGKYPDKLRISNNEYHICLYHAYNNEGEITSYDKFRKFTFDESTTAIPHLEKFSLAA